MTRVDQIFVGALSTLPPEGHATGIFKHAVTLPVEMHAGGLAGDVQADRRVHGGADKAVHHYAAENYEILKEYFPEHEAMFVPGSIGENISTRGWHENNVCIGDIFRIGVCRVQVSQPRSPCWKINARYGIEELSLFIQERALAGWYYRVLQTGLIGAGDEFELIERNADPVSIREFWRVYLQARPALSELWRIAATPGLNVEMRGKLEQRMAWLEKQG